MCEPKAISHCISWAYASNPKNSFALSFCLHILLEQNVHLLVRHWWEPIFKAAMGHLFRREAHFGWTRNEFFFLFVSDIHTEICCFRSQEATGHSFNLTQSFISDVSKTSRNAFFFLSFILVWFGLSHLPAQRVDNSTVQLVIAVSLKSAKRDIVFYRLIFYDFVAICLGMRRTIFHPAWLPKYLKTNFNYLIATNFVILTMRKSAFCTVRLWFRSIFACFSIRIVLNLTAPAASSDWRGDVRMASVSWITVSDVHVRRCIWSCKYEMPCECLLWEQNCCLSYFTMCVLRSHCLHIFVSQHSWYGIASFDCSAFAAHLFFFTVFGSI